MGGLHNKFPGYFYKRGNLFNTYLGSGEPATRVGSRPSSARRTAPLSDSPPRPRADTPQEKLVAFIQLYFTLDDMDQWLRLVANHLGRVPPSDRRIPPYKRVAAFVHTSLDA